MKKAIILSTLFVAFALILAYLEILPGIHKEKISQFHFLDFVSIFFILSTQILLKKKKKVAFVFYGIGIIANLGMGYMMESYVIIMFSILIFGINIKNWIEWNKEDKRKESLPVNQ